MRAIRETKNIGSDVYERVVGCSLNLHELVEEVEQQDFEIGEGDEIFYVGREVEYEVFVSGKRVDSSKITIAIYDKEEDKPTYWHCEASGDEFETEELVEAQELTKMSKEELIAKVLYYKAGNG